MLHNKTEMNAKKPSLKCKNGYRVSRTSWVIPRIFATIWRMSTASSLVIFLELENPLMLALWGLQGNEIIRLMPSPIQSQR